MLSSIYLSCPSFLQSLAISLYGAKTYRDRFDGRLPDLYAELDPPLSEPSALTHQLQDLRLKLLLEHCSQYVPRYRKILNQCDWRDITAKNISNYFPVIRKVDILENPDEFLSTSPEFRKNILKLNTSGSSGTPLKIFSSYEARKINYHFYQKLILSCGSSYRSKSTTIAGRVLYKNTTKSFDRYDYINRTQYLSAYCISPSTIENYINALNNWQPEFIDSYPSALIEIQQLATAAELTLNFSPKFILTSSETLSIRDRLKIEDFFGCRIIDHYGCTEMTVSAFSNGGKYYASPLYSVLELDPVADDSYSLITTGLLNFAMPLIRYEIGDSVSVDDPGNPYVFNSVEGRLDDIIVTPEGRKIGRIDPAFKGVEGIDFSQVIQEGVDKLHIKIVLNERLKNKFKESLLVDNIKIRTSPLMNVSISYHQKIDKAPNGKFKSVISNLKK